MIDSDHPAAAAPRARETAHAAAARAGVTIRGVHEIADLELARRLTEEIWHPAATEPLVTPSLLRALSHGGNPCTLAYAGDEPVGVCLGFLGTDPPRSLHSHIAGVLPAAAGRHVGFALKADQRAWALEHELTTITWTFDPLVRRNAYFNASKLGALPTAYLVDFYGTKNDAINAGQATDRLFVTWCLADRSVAATMDGAPSAPDAAELRAAGAAVVLEEVDGAPVAADDDARAAVRLVRVPADIEALRRTAPEAALRWRLAVRGVLGGLMDDGWRVTGMSRDGYYVVRKAEG